ncbi:MAG: dienelactone hydrolase family protein [Armatimonadota bacterium]|nr:dienelactone hydrolase family protein [Armatimonadota bacterium]MDR7436938.1 dienelactone hydrolase family protein [Armatimonadota bacterium]MDR7472288.1 dienelactone hydrolase family protein [Armatimonadota bacterium]MDR7506753.1 dienelactone hydrolase family protein [Armatimonadota bacterium]MDR7508376.1 dienelactone hydrolase family protein [Armatimonadota bacterium]
MTDAAVVVRSVRVPVEGGALDGDLAIPAAARGVVAFAHGSGSSRHSPRNRYVARRLQDAGLATLLIDLLTPEEEDVDRATAHLRFDIPLLGRRLLDIVRWVERDPQTAPLPLGLFGASTGAAAALRAAAERPDRVAAVVSRGGRPDLAADILPRVTAPTLLIVGGRDLPVLDLNRQALALLGGPARLEIVPGAGHLFEEPGALDRVAGLAAEWFLQHLSSAPGSPRSPAPDA